jgi:hypothetical protein
MVYMQISCDSDHPVLTQLIASTSVDMAVSFTYSLALKCCTLKPDAFEYQQSSVGEDKN